MEEAQLDRAGRGLLVADMFEGVTSRQYDRLCTTIGELLEQGQVLDAPTLDRLKTAAVLERTAFKAATTATDLGQFTTVISTKATDREKDIVEADAMVSALRAWTLTGKVVPLHWNHLSDPENIVGHVEPESVKSVAGEVIASGWVDQSTDRGAHVWRLMKSGTLGFSFGYLITASTERTGGGRKITGLDVFEVSATPTPMNNRTRVLATKALDPEYDELRERLRREMYELLTAPASGETGEKTIAAKSSAPIQVATFEC